MQFLSAFHLLRQRVLFNINVAKLDSTRKMADYVISNVVHMALSQLWVEQAGHQQQMDLAQSGCIRTQLEVVRACLCLAYKCDMACGLVHMPQQQSQCAAICSTPFNADSYIGLCNPS